MVICFYAIMWSPTHVQVTVFRARDLLVKGKNGTNDVFALIVLGKNQFRTSVKQKALPINVDWNEQCQMEIPVDEGNKAEVTVTLLHQNFIGVDEFLGRIALPLVDFDVYETPKIRWYSLQSKVGHTHKANRLRGQIEMKIAFTVQQANSDAAQLNGPRATERLSGSVGHLSTRKALSFGGSLLNVRNKPKQVTSGLFKKKLQISTDSLEKLSTDRFNPFDEEIECEANESNRLPVEKLKVEDPDNECSGMETSEKSNAETTHSNDEAVVADNLTQVEPNSFTPAVDSSLINQELNSHRCPDIIEEEPEFDDSNPITEQELKREEDDESSDSDERIIEIDPVILKHSLEEISYPNTINNEVPADLDEVAAEDSKRKISNLEVIENEVAADEVPATAVITAATAVSDNSNPVIIENEVGASKTPSIFDSSESNVSNSKIVDNKTQIGHDKFTVTAENSEIQVPDSETTENEFVDENVQVDFDEDPTATKTPEDEIEVDTICNIQKSVPESEMMKPEETSDSQVVIEESRVMFQKNSYENQHFRLGNVIGEMSKKVKNALNDYHHLSKEELVETLLIRDQHIRDLSEYIDILLVRVLNSCPSLLSHS